MKEQVKEFVGLEKEISNAISNLDFSEMNLIHHTKINSTLVKISKSIFEYFENPTLKEITVNQPNSIQLKITNTKKQIIFLNEKIEQILREEDSLLKEEENLEKKEKEYKNLVEKLDSLKKLKELLAIIDQENSDKEIINYEKINKEKLQKLSEKIGKVNKIIESETIKIEDVNQKNFKIFNDQFNQLKLATEGQITHIDKYLEDVKSRELEFSNAHNLLITEYNQYIDKLNDILIEINNIDNIHSKNVEIYKRHFEENEKIWGRLNDKGATSNYVKEVMELIKTNLKDFDTEIKNVIEKKNDLIISTVKK